MKIPTNANVLVGLEKADDAGVYKVSEDLAIIQTVDFFTPIVDNPYWFGQIAAANALSDIYAMGGVPKTAMNLVGFPLKQMDISILRQIIQGGLDKLKEADVVILPEAIEYAKMGLMPGGTFKNKEFRLGMIEFSSGVDPLIQDILFDPQTSGGLMICVKREQADALVCKLIDEGVAASKIIGEVIRAPVEQIFVE